MYILANAILGGIIGYVCSVNRMSILPTLFVILLANMFSITCMLHFKGYF